MNIKKYLWITTLSLACLTAVAEEELAPSKTPETVVTSETYKIRIRALGTGRLVKRAEIKIGTRLFFTDPKGETQLPLPAGEGQIQVSRYGFESVLIKFEKIRSAKQPLEIFLPPGSPDDNEVYISGSKRPSISKRSTSIGEAKRISDDSDPVKVTRLMPGVQSEPFSPQIGVRGSPKGDNLYYIDHLKVMDIYHFVGGISVFPDQLTSEVEFYGGGYGPQFGDVTGGVIVLKTKTEIPEDPGYEARMNIPLYAGAFHERPIEKDKKSLAVSVRRSYVDQFIPFAMPDDSNVSIKPYFTDGHVMYTEKKDDGGHLKIIGMGSNDIYRIETPYSESEEQSGRGKADLDLTYSTIGAEKHQPLGNGWSYSLTPQFLYSKFRVSFLGDKFNTNYYEARLHFELSKRLSKNQYFYVGIEPIFGREFVDIVFPPFQEDPLYDGEEAPREGLHQSFTYRDVAAWAATDIGLGSLIITPGLRFFYNDQIQQTGADPRLSMRLKINEEQTLNAAVGQYSQSPKGIEADSEFGNEELTFEKSNHYITGLHSKWNERWETDLQLYYKRTYGVVTSDLETRYSNEGSWYARGLEMFLRRNLTDRYFAWISYSYIQGKFRHSDVDDWISNGFDESHNFLLAGSYRLTATWDLGGRFTYNSGGNYVVVNDAVYNATYDKYQPRYNEDDQNKMSDYYNIDLFVTKNFLFKTWQLEWRTGVNYITFKPQVSDHEYNYDFSESNESKINKPIPFVELRGVI